MFPGSARLRGPTEKELLEMLHDLLGAAFICMGALTIYARITARSLELHRPSSSPLAPPQDPR
jgi:hypothetical protein